MIELICAYTGEKFLKDRREYNRQTRNGKTLFYKDRETAIKAVNEKRPVKQIILENRSCKKCSKSFVVASNKVSHFCSTSCCSSWNWDIFKKSDGYEKFVLEASKNSLKRKVWKNKKDDLISTEITVNKCVICNKSFVTKAWKTKLTCSKACYGKVASINSKAHPNCGGETNYKKFVYDGITMDSSWEVEIAKWMDENNVAWVRSRKLMFLWTDEKGDRRRYYPDFYLPKYNIYLDPKNKFLIEKDRFKIETAQKENNIKIIWGHKDLILNYLKTL